MVVLSTFDGPHQPHQGEFALMSLDGTEAIRHFLVQFVSPYLDFLPTQSFRKPGDPVVLIMMLQTQEHEIVLGGVLIIPIEVGELAFLDFVLALQPKAKAAAPTTSEKNACLCTVRNCLASHRS